MNKISNDYINCEPFLKKPTIIFFVYFVTGM